MQNLFTALHTRRMFLDGGMGSLLQAQGLAPGEWPERWNCSHPEVIRAVHSDYLRAGADILTCNTFGANALKMEETELTAIIRAAVENAMAARRDCAREDDAYIALDLGPTGRLLQPLGDLDFERAVALYRQVAAIGAQAGADLLLIETMADIGELKAAVLGAKEACSLPVFATVTLDAKGKLLTGGDLSCVVALLEGLRVDALGVNCGLGPAQLAPFVKELLSLSSLPVIASPNAGLPRSEGGHTRYDIDEAAFAQHMRTLCEAGVSLAGGCCGTTPEHIRRMCTLCREVPVAKVERKRRTLISSYARAVEIGPAPVLIGERINPTGKKRLKQALEARDMAYLLEEAVRQEECGAHVLDVNVGVPGVDEPALMEETVRALQGVTDLPLQIDTANPQAMERGLRAYRGKPLINSVSGKQDVMDAVFPLAARYGGAVVALLLDEDGIPATAQGRIDIARRILRHATQYGIGPEDILVDGLCMTLSTDVNAARVTLETVRRARAELGLHTILGVSNVSFGLPLREQLNASFLTLALEAGLSAAIVNVCAPAMIDAYHTYLALAGLDPQCARYIAAYQEAAPRSKPAPAARRSNGPRAAETLFDAILHGLSEQSGVQAQALLERADPLEVINAHIVPALARVGEGFERGKLFLPQLLMSAEAAKAAFEKVRARIEATGGAQEKKACVVLATVQGDIHDIGKNIVRALLENYGYDVIDLGKDVAPEAVLQAVKAHHAPLCGLSALMTTTVPAMEATIALLHREAPGVRVLVGGAVLTPEYAARIGADAYCADAMATVRAVQALTGEREA